MKDNKHNERCRDCKINVERCLEEIFGRVESNRDLDVPCRLDDYRNTEIYQIIEPIYEALQNHRGFNNFVRSKKLPRVDYFVPNINLIVEFDESQHFTQPRDISLSFYSADVRSVGYSAKKWRSICQQLQMCDNDPVYRDEQRAWYDTIRDFVPILWSIGYTARLFSRDYAWCTLDPKKENDLNIFKQFLSNKLSD